jgi:hypothetical protein
VVADISEFAEEGADYEIFDYPDRTPAPEPTNPALLECIKFFIPEVAVDGVERFVNDLAGRDVPAWKTADFSLRPPSRKRRDDWDDEDEDEEEEEPSDPGAANLARLIHQFMGYLRREEGAPFSRGELVRHHLFRYFLRRHEGDLNPQPSMLERARHPNRKLPLPPRPIHPLCLERVTLEVHLSRLVGQFNGLYHTAAALFELVPAWLRFLESRGLIDADLRKKNLEELRPLHADLLKALQNYTDDPTLYRNLQAWPADAGKGPGDLRGE